MLATQIINFWGTLDHLASQLALQILGRTCLNIGLHLFYLYILNTTVIGQRLCPGLYLEPEGPWGPQIAPKVLAI
jgi:hypothetical protein